VSKKLINNERDIDDCAFKLQELLREYNAKIYLDEDLCISLADLDTGDSLYLAPKADGKG
jgi:hypothetical protein